VAEEIAVAAFGVAGEVVGAFVDLLHERGFGVDDTSRLEDAADLLHDRFRLQHVFEDRLDDNAIHRAVA
jgi:hypothetical protein